MHESALTAAQRVEVYDRLAEVVAQQIYDPELQDEDWSASLKTYRDKVANTKSDEEFEQRISELLAALRCSHVGFYHGDLRRATAKMALCAQCTAHQFNGDNYWVFQSVHDGGPAAKAGIQPGDVLLSVNGREFRPKDHPFFEMEATSRVRVIARDGTQIERLVVVPTPTKKKGQLPYVEPHPVVSHRRVNHDTGYVKVAMYPGEVGIDVANDISNAVRHLRPINRLIVDLRGNTGGGIGVLRLLSLLTPERLPVGLSLGGKIESPEDAKNAVIFNWIPKYKIGLGLLAAKFESVKYIRKLQGRKMSIAVQTEGLGPQPFNGRVVLLVDRNTSSANEILISFARENKLALIVGEPTPGRLLSGEKFSLPYNYWVALPIADYRTSAGATVEGAPIVPDVTAPFSLDEVRQGKDTQLTAAVEVVSQM